MSLKAFHILFVTLSSLLAFTFGTWAFMVPSENGLMLYRAMGVSGFVLGAGLIAYGFWFWRKVKRLA